ncbi:GBF-interacting protein 1-like isoform X1 [Bidens hawaiensis]|uniref:GBF-interacting protein 1-like isoform X1 n=1 Tax=Bidens hawaiensis TaxID=980011 RepID=UPI00404ADAD7
MNNNNSGGVKLSIPHTLRKKIQNLKEITGNHHSEDEVYTMLKECNMDPNETAQKLLSQDPFHEVRRKGNRKKEQNLVKESAEPKWKPGMQGRGSRGGRGNSNYPSRHGVHDAGGSRKALSGKESEINQDAVDGVILPAPRDKKNKAFASASIVADNKESEVKILTAALGDLSADPLLPESQQRSLDKVNETLVENKRPPSNYNNRSQQAITSHKVGSVKEWKPKPTNPVPISVPVEVETHSSSKMEAVIPESKESQIPDGQQVIIPNHLHVPEADKLGFCFGSFDASFGLISNTLIGPGPMSDKSPSVSEASEEITEHIEEHVDRNQDVLPTADEVSSNVIPDHTESKQETSLPVPGHQYPVARNFIPPIIGSQLAPFESNESQPRDASSVPTFVVPQPFDPVGYFHTPKYNGNVPVLSHSQPTFQSSQEVGAGPTPLASQAGGVMLPQQPLPMFRQPTGLHLPHYPPNYIPYAPYYPPFYIPPHGIPQFLSNGAFPQQPPPGSMHPAAKYPLQQYKPVTAGNSTSNDDIGASQFKESNVYVTGQQASSFYNLPQGGQVAYAPTQAPHTTFAGMYQPVTTTPVHPLLQQTQTMAGGVDMVGPTSTVYQQPPLPPQINWPNNY